MLLTQAAGASAVADRREELYRCYIATLNLNGRTPDGVRGDGADALVLLERGTDAVASWRRRCQYDVEQAVRI